MLPILLKDVTHKKEELCCLYGGNISLYQQQYQYTDHFQSRLNTDNISTNNCSQSNGGRYVVHRKTTKESVIQRIQYI